MLEDKDLLSIQQARQRVERAYLSAQTFKDFTQEQVDRIVEVMAAAARHHARRLAELAVQETGYGKVEDKVKKNLFCCVDVYRYLKDLKTCGVIREDPQRKIIEIGVPVGVVAAIVPSTNPTSTIIFKVLSAIKGRNTVVLSPHPHALHCSVETARVLYEAALKAGAPEGCINWMDAVTLEGTHELMRHRRTGLILATGGSGLVRSAYSSGKPAFGVGPGNVPTFVERTANVAKAVRDIVAGKTFDNGVLCSSEQSLICDRPIEKQVLEELKKNRAYWLDDQEIDKVNRLLQLPNKRLNPQVVGKSAQALARLAGISVPSDASCLVGRCQGVGPEFPLSMEKLSPILAFFVEDGWEAGCERCIEILNFGGMGHTMSIHSSDSQVIMKFGLYKPAYRICVNTPATLGAVGLTTGVPPSMTLGCGTPGGNITSDNITSLHLINIKRLAFETRPVDSISYAGELESGDPVLVSESPDPTAPPSEAKSSPPDSLRKLVRSAVQEYLENNSPGAVEAALPEPLPIQVEPAQKEPPRGPAVDFVCEDDVRRAQAAGQKIVVNQATIITPSAQDLGHDRDIFIWE